LKIQILIIAKHYISIHKKRSILTKEREDVSSGKSHSWKEIHESPKSISFRKSNSSIRQIKFQSIAVNQLISTRLGSRTAACPVVVGPTPKLLRALI